MLIGGSSMVITQDQVDDIIHDRPKRKKIMFEKTSHFQPRKMSDKYIHHTCKVKT